MSSLITWDTIIKNALQMWEDRDRYAYWYDIKGKVLTDSAMDYIISIHPEHYKRWTPEQIKELKDFSRGKIGYDCSGFLWAVTEGRVGGSADSIYKQSSQKWSNTIDNWAGTALHKPGHIGLDIGYGWGLHMPIEGHTVELVHSRNYDWQDACKLYGIDYAGADNR